MSDDALLASVLRKFIAADEFIAVHDESATIDGWVGDLTPDEIAALHRAKAELTPS